MSSCKSLLAVNFVLVPLLVQVSAETLARVGWHKVEGAPCKLTCVYDTNVNSTNLGKLFNVMMFWFCLSYRGLTRDGETLLPLLLRLLLLHLAPERAAGRRKNCTQNERASESERAREEKREVGAANANAGALLLPMMVLAAMCAGFANVACRLNAVAMRAQ